MHIGFIGTGNMGTVLIESFIKSGVLLPSNISATNRTKEKTARLLAKYPGLRIGSCQEITQQADLLFLCVKPLDYIQVINEIKGTLSPEKIIISITSSIEPNLLETILPFSKTARIIPSITNAVLRGVSLLTYGSHLSDEDKKMLYNLMSSISTPIEIDSSITRISSDMVSCGPAFFSFLMQRFIDHAVLETNISEDEATKMMTAMIIGLGRLLEEGGYSLPELQAKVCVPGGITGVGLHIIDKETSTVFRHTIRATQEKFRQDLKEAEESFQHYKNPYH